MSTWKLFKLQAEINTIMNLDAKRRIKRQEAINAIIKACKEHEEAVKPVLNGHKKEK